MTEPSTLNSIHLNFLLKNCLPLSNQDRKTVKIGLRRIKLVELWNTPSFQLCNNAQFGKALKVSAETVRRDLLWLSNRNLLLPLQQKPGDPFAPSESMESYIKRLLTYTVNLEKTPKITTKEQSNNVR